MSLLDAIAELIRAAIRESECVGFFAIIIILLVIMHSQNLRRIDEIRQKLHDHTDNCPNGK